VNRSGYRIAPYSPSALWLGWGPIASSLSISSDGRQVVISRPWWRGGTHAITAIAPGSELLFCRRVGYGALIEFQILLRAPDGSDQVLGNYGVDAISRSIFSRRNRKKITEEVPRLFGIGVRSVTQSVSQSGAEELDWSVEDDKRQWRNLRRAILPGLAPFFGVLARLVTPGPGKIAAMGAALWIVCVGILYLDARRSKPGPTGRLWVVVLTWTLLFAPTYAATALLMNAVLDRAR
jgi:hypothetical protein